MAEDEQQAETTGGIMRMGPEGLVQGTMGPPSEMRGVTVQHSGNEHIWTRPGRNYWTDGLKQALRPLQRETTLSKDWEYCPECDTLRYHPAELSKE